MEESNDSGYMVLEPENVIKVWSRAVETGVLLMQLLDHSLVTVTSRTRTLKSSLCFDLRHTICLEISSGIFHILCLEISSVDARHH